MKSSELDRLADRELVAALRTFNGGTTGIETNLSLTGSMSARLKDKIDAFEADLDAFDAARVAEDSATGAKKASRKEAIAEARQQMRLARATPGMTGEQLGKVGLDEYDTTPTDSPSPTTAPFALIDYGKLKHTIFFRDSAAPDSEAKPKGMLGVEIYHHVGTTPPTSLDNFTLLAFDTSSPYTAFYEMEDAGKKAYYILRWKSKNDETGEWSETVEATING